MQTPWYKTVFTLPHTPFHGTTDFIRDHIGFKYALVPVTTDAIRSQWVLDLIRARTQMSLR